MSVKFETKLSQTVADAHRQNEITFGSNREMNLLTPIQTIKNSSKAHWDGDQFHFFVVEKFTDKSAAV